MPVRRTQAIGAGIAAADDDNVLIRRQDLIGNLIAGHTLVLLRQKFHGKVDAFQFAAGHIQIAAPFGPAAEQQRIELGPQLFHRNIHANVRVDAEFHTFSFHLQYAPVDVVLLHLEIGNAVTQ